MPTRRPEPLEAERNTPGPSECVETPVPILDSKDFVSISASASPTDLSDDTLPDLPETPKTMTTAALVGPLTSHQIHHQVWTLAWPSVMAMLLQTFNSLMDVFFVGHLAHGAQALAATGVGGGVMFLLISMAMGVSVGTTALVARFTGAGDREGAIQATAQSLTLGFLLALLVGTLAYLGRGHLVAWMLDVHRSPEAAALCVQFLGASLLASVPLFLMNVLMGAFRGLGDTRTPLLITFASITTHITFNALLIYGRLGFPRLGVRGAGTALALSIYVATLLYLWALYRRTPLKEALQARHLRLQREWAWRILKIGIPAAVQAVLRTLSMMTFTGMLARTLEGAAGVAALQIGVRAESLAFMPGFGYSVAAAALVGQSLGAKNPERAERYGWAATGQAIVVMSLMAVLFFVCAAPFAHLFTSDLNVQRLGADYLRINASCEPFLALGMVLTGALQGAGDTIRPTFITLLTMWLVRLPLAYWLMFVCRLQTHGAWLSMTLTTIVGGVLTLFLFRSGKWKRIKV
jgi:putative MATE family efflux protein